MEIFAAGLRRVVTVAILVAALSALVGFLVAHFAGLGGAAQGAGWGMCLGGALTALVTGQSGSPSRMAMEGRWGAFGQYWGQNPALPQSPLWLLGSSLIVFAGGIAVIVLTY
ncbi:MAG: hypothetical protein ACYDCH_14565 [Gaiellaceae bacterium]